MYNKLMKYTAICGILFTICAMGVMFYFSMHKSEYKKKENILATEQVEDNGEKTKKEIFLSEKSTSIALGISVSTETSEGDIKLESNYLDQQLYVTIDGLEQGFFDQNKLIGNSDYIKSIQYIYAQGKTTLEIQLSNLYEHTVVYKNNMIYFEFEKPKERYDQIVVIDPQYGGENYGTVYNGENGKDITLAIAKSLKQKLDKTNICVYYTRLDDITVSEEKRVRLANVAKADMFISIGVAEDEQDESKKGTQTIYNPNFFIPKFNSIDLANVLEEEVVMSAKSNANGLNSAKDKDIVVNEATVPVALVEVGYLSNKEERNKLKEQDYIDLVANGIYKGILRAYQVQESEQ